MNTDYAIRIVVQADGNSEELRSYVNQLDCKLHNTREHGSIHFNELRGKVVCVEAFLTEEE